MSVRHMGTLSNGKPYNFMKAFSVYKQGDEKAGNTEGE